MGFSRVLSPFYNFSNSSGFSNAMIFHVPSVSRLAFSLIVADVFFAVFSTTNVISAVSSAFFTDDTSLRERSPLSAKRVRAKRPSRIF